MSPEVWLHRKMCIDVGIVPMIALNVIIMIMIIILNYSFDAFFLLRC